MQYFSTLPKVIYQTNGTAQIFTNLLARASMLPEFVKNSANYYEYYVQEGDTPEIIANKYYGDSYRYWIVLFSNQITDPQWDWPMSVTLFEEFMRKKYVGVNPQNIMHHYEKTITRLNVDTQIKSVETIVLDENLYDELLERTYTVNTPWGKVTTTVEKQAVTLYDYEYKVNESKKTISLLNSIYVDEIETELKKLMAS
jgi:hypothetical protein